MICPKCKISMTPDKKTHQCPECWSEVSATMDRLSWFISSKMRDLVHKMNMLVDDMESELLKYRCGLIPKMPSQRYLATFGLEAISKSAPNSIVGQHGILMRKFDLLYHYDQRSYGGWFERDSVTIIEERALVSSVVAAIIVAFFVVNEIFNFF